MSNDKIGSSMPSRLQKIFHHRSDSLFGTPSPLYVACQRNDLERVKSCLKKMKFEEIDHQYPPNNETALHVATRNQHKEIIETLLSYGAQRSLRNSYDQHAYDLAETSEIRDSFKRPSLSRFVYRSSDCKSPTSSELMIKCKSCSLVNDDNYYEWELIDQNAREKALKYRHDLKPSTEMNEKDLKEKIHLIKKGYLNTRLQNISSGKIQSIQNYFERVVIEQNPDYIITAFTTCQTFSNLLNTDMSRNVIHDLKKGCSRFSCDCLYSTEDGIKSIISILYRHPKFEKLSFTGVVYRGIVLPKNKLDHYKEDSCIITTTFVATSKTPEVAQMYGTKDKDNSANHSFFCTYEIINNNRTAFDISTISDFKHEDEILILPYSAFIITKIEEGDEVTKIYLKEQTLTHMFNLNGSQQYSLISTTRLLENIGRSLFCDTN